MRRLVLLLSASLITLWWVPSIGCAQQTVHGTLSGNLGPGTYIVDGDCQVLSGQSLTIRPGTTFLHSGHFTWMIYGQVSAVGTANEPIRFIRQFPYEAHKWGGFRFQQGSSSQSVLEWCELDYCKNIAYPTYNGGAIYLEHVAITIRNCKITNGQASDGGGIYANYSPAGLIIDNCLVANCTSGNGGGIYLNYSDGASITNFIIKNNSSSRT